MTEESVLIIVGEYSAASAVAPAQTFETLGVDVDFADPDKGAGDRVKTSIPVYEGEDRMFTERRGRDFVCTVDFGAVDAADYSGLLLPGGRAPEYLAADEAVVSLVRAFDADGKPIGANCHGTQVVAGADIVEGRRCTGLDRLRPILENAGAQFVPPDGARGDQTGVVVDGNLVTAAQSSSYPGMLRELLDGLDVALP